MHVEWIVKVFALERVMLQLRRSVMAKTVVVVLTGL